jgi:tRNA(fMet)-specific endonuclease VapC
MILYLLDTNAVSAALKGNAALDRRLQDLPAAQWCISAVTRAELRFGVALRPEATRLTHVVDAFLSIARTVAWDSGAADAHGQLRATLTAKGRRIGDFDEMIAAHALALGATLITDNVRHFSRVSGLKIENWIR